MNLRRYINTINNKAYICLAKYRVKKLKLKTKKFTKENKNDNNFTTFIGFIIWKEIARVMYGFFFIIDCD